MKIKVLATLTGKVKTYENGIITGIKNHSVDELIVSKSGISGDAVHNLKYHGGDMRVLHHYTEAHYKYFKEKFPEIADRFIPGSYGENLYTDKLSEADLCVGDIFTLGTTKIQLTASRRPCATINFSYQDQRILKEILITGRTGWFYRVLEEGIVKPGDFLEMIERPFPELPLSRIHTEGYGLSGDRDLKFLKACLDSGMMEKGWKPAMEKILGMD